MNCPGEQPQNLASDMPHAMCHRLVETEEPSLASYSAHQAAQQLPPATRVEIRLVAVNGKRMWFVGTVKGTSTRRGTCIELDDVEGEAMGSARAVGPDSCAFSDVSSHISKEVSKIRAHTHWG